MALLKEKLKDVAPRMCDDCQRRAETNPLRVLDCKVPEDQPIIDDAAIDSGSFVRTVPRPISARCERIWTTAGIPYEVRPRMVRGLDYYMRTTFEIMHGSLGAQNSRAGRRPL